MSADVVVTRTFMDPAEWGLYALVVMQVCAYGETPPERVEEVASAENPPGSSSRWRIIWGDDESDPLNNSTKAPAPCSDDPARIHYLLSC